MAAIMFYLLCENRLHRKNRFVLRHRWNFWVRLQLQICPDIQEFHMTHNNLELNTKAALFELSFLFTWHE